MTMAFEEVMSPFINEGVNNEMLTNFPLELYQALPKIVSDRYNIILPHQKRAAMILLMKLP